MKELLRTNDPVLISFIVSLLTEAQIEHVVLDTNMSIIEGSLGILPCRLMVEGEKLDQARFVLTEAGIEDHAN